MKTAIVYDLDMTVANNKHRVKFIQGKKEWDKFFGACLKDELIKPTFDVLKSLEACNPHTEFIVCTGRPERFRQPSLNWLQFHGLKCDRIFMRPDNDRRPDYVSKADLMDEILKEYKVKMVFEDKQKVTTEWEKRGCFVFKIKGDD